VAKVVEDFLINNGGTMDSAISISIEDEYLKLRVNANIQLLDDLTKHLGTYAMAFFRVWLLHISQKNCITHLHL
jgi:hypothetical protein